MADEYFVFRSPKKRTRVVKKRDKGIPPAYHSLGKPGRSEQYSRLAPKLASLNNALTQKQLKFADASDGAVAEEILVMEIAGSLEEFREVVEKVEGMD